MSAGQVLVLLVVIGVAYGAYRVLAEVLTSAIEPIATPRRFATVATEGAVRQAFRDGMTWLGWRVIDEGNPMIAAPPSSRPRVLCEIEERDGTREVLVGLPESSIDDVGAHTILAGSTATLAQARTIRFRLDRFESRLNAIDPHLRAT